MIRGYWNKTIENLQDDNILVSQDSRLKKYIDGDNYLIIECNIFNSDELGIDINNIAEDIYRLYKKTGDAFFSKINGSFLCIIKDNTKINIARDHHGIEAQLYYNDKIFSTSLEV